MVSVPDFDAVYRRDPDPWQVRSSRYEQRKLEIVLASLGRATYERAWDPACGVGELVLRLAQRCGSVLATDASPVAVEITRRHTSGEPRIDVREAVLPANADPRSAASFDLMVLSEFLYYLDADARSETLALLDAVRSPRAEVMSLHWRHQPGDAWLSGADTQAEITDTLTGRGWQHTVHHDDVDFVLDAFTHEELAGVGGAA